VAEDESETVDWRLATRVQSLLFVADTSLHPTSFHCPWTQAYTGTQTSCRVDLQEKIKRKSSREMGSSQTLKLREALSPLSGFTHSIVDSDTIDRHKTRYKSKPHSNLMTIPPSKLGNNFPEFHLLDLA
jgi:hypothetical protein